MAEITLRGNPIHTAGELPEVGTAAPSFDLVGLDLGAIDSASLAGSSVVLNIFPSVDTPTCATSVRTFNVKAAERDGVKVVNVSHDLPFALGRFCAAEGIENVSSGSAFRSSFGQDYGLTITDGPLAGLLARSVVVLDAEGKVVYTELVPEIASEPDYEAALASLG